MSNENEEKLIKVAIVEALDHFTSFNNDDNNVSKTIIRYIGEIVGEDDDYIILEGKRYLNMLDMESQFLTFHILKKVIERIGIADIQMKEVDHSLDKFDLKHYS